MKTINLFYLSGNTTGGWVTFTVHLIHALRSVGAKVNLYKVGNTTESKERSFGYSVKYRNLDFGDAADIVQRQPSLIVAAAKNFQSITNDLIELGAKLIVHDPTELKNIPVELLDNTNTVVIRKAGLEFLPFANLILHPYKRQSLRLENVRRSKICVSTSRIDFDKNTTILLDANRLIEEVDPEVQKIQIYGFENRLYTRFKVCPNYPEWEQSKCAYPREENAAFNILSDAMFMADMSIIKGDGGGTQYTTLEAWDAGAVPIIHKDWIRPEDEMVHRENCLAVPNERELVLSLQIVPITEIERLRENGYKALLKHDPEVIGRQYMNLFGE